MIINPNSKTAFVLVTVLMLIMTFALPLVDRLVCRKLGVSIDDGISTNPNADRLLVIRKGVLILTFGLYLLMVGYVAFFCRVASMEYAVNAALFQSLMHSFDVDYGFFEFLHVLFQRGFAYALEHVRITRPQDIAQVYMNIAMFVPMGYLLPYVFDWFRQNIRLRTVTACFLVSLLIENLQLITRLGLYDLDDLVSNTFGGFIGQGLFVAVAYVNTHPEWRTEVHQLHAWRWKSRKTWLHPFFRKIHVVRSTIYCTDEKTATDFFVTRMGLLMRKKIADATSKESRMLLYCNKTQIEVICGSPADAAKGEAAGPAGGLPAQTVTIAANNSERIRKRLLENGVEVSGYALDPYTNLRTFSVAGPDNITLTFIEE